MSGNSRRQRHILLVEDSLSDVLMLKEGFKARECQPEITNVADGRAALDFLEQCRQENQLPDIILLDLDLPGLNGKELLTILKSDEDLRRIPAIVLTGSKSEGDLRQSYDLQANGYLVKPDDLAGLHDLAALIDQYWFGNLNLSE